ncbi:uncharacterized protein N7511_003019 [Penicillium nucicola]|uniref:uncharacterized protein n=1 Tax=Penicillium nucicola TaxID=1850975 RepID=UPI002545572F|nr:uncharacterized protein N7511_003019 [Penicillium nucicola]KAJ5770968.1 hypothetical protein N7511_003019 [Penicillium nucicola]
MHNVDVYLYDAVVWRLPNGPEYRESDSDEYGVFHFHFDHIMQRNGEFRVGIYAIVAFHGQDYVEQNRYPRVDGNDNQGENRRSHVLNCNTGNDVTDQTHYFYPGDGAESDYGDNEHHRAIWRFANYLQQEDLVTEQTFTGAQRGQLTRYRDPQDECPTRWYFDWGGYRQGRPFTPEYALGQAAENDRMDDNDDV